jgi:hypothetical protein
MKQTQFLGWIKKAYPDTRTVKKDNGDVWLSSDGYLQVVARVDNFIEFHKLADRKLEKAIVISEDAEIVINIRNLWGEPKVAFAVPTQQKTEASEPKKEQPKNTAQETKKINREKIIERLKAEFPDLIEISKVPGGKAVKVGGSKLTLYDYGISSKPSVFIPWAREEEVEMLVSNFISLNK